MIKVIVYTILACERLFRSKLQSGLFDIFNVSQSFQTLCTKNPPPEHQNVETIKLPFF